MVLEGGKKHIRPFVSHRNVSGTERNFDHQPDDEETVRDDDVAGRPKDIELSTNPTRPQTITPRSRHGKGPRGTSNRGWVVSSVFAPREPAFIPKCHVDHKKDGPEVQICAITRERQKGMVRT